MEPTWLRLRSAPDQQRAYLLRSRVIKAIRAFFDAQDFEEVETPLLVAAPGMEPYLDVFETRLTTAHGQSARAFLTTSPEYAMKKLLVAGLPRIYQICKSFRNGEEISRGHNPEFTILEWYRTHADYRAIMTDCENLFLAIWNALNPDTDPDTEPMLTVGDSAIRLTPPWERLMVQEAFARYAHLDLDTLGDAGTMRRVLNARGYQTTDDTTWEQGYHQIFLNEIEPRLGRIVPTILIEYPASMAALARRKADDPRYAERFEFYIAGIELGNAFSELTDADEQRARLEAERAERAALGRTLYEIDADFLRALRVGMPPSAGIAVGVDRIIMLFAGVDAIQETLWFPASEIFGA